MHCSSIGCHYPSLQGQILNWHQYPEAPYTPEAGWLPGSPSISPSLRQLITLPKCLICFLSCSLHGCGRHCGSIGAAAMLCAPTRHFRLYLAGSLVPWRRHLRDAYLQCRCALQAFPECTTLCQSTLPKSPVYELHTRCRGHWPGNVTVVQLVECQSNKGLIYLDGPSAHNASWRKWRRSLLVPSRL